MGSLKQPLKVQQRPGFCRPPQDPGGSKKSVNMNSGDSLSENRAPKASAMFDSGNRGLSRHHAHKPVTTYATKLPVVCQSLVLLSLFLVI